MTLDLDAYCARIGYHGPREPTLAVLRQLHALHPAAIAFENLDPFLDRAVAIDLPAVQAKLVGSRRGGYCFEQNGLFCAVLRAVGFVSTPVMARVVWGAPPHAPRTGLTHRLTVIDMPEGRFIADVGFGGASPTAPLKLQAGAVQETPHGLYRLTEFERGYQLQTRIGDAWLTMYRFTLDAQADADFEMGNWFTSTHPRSHFRHNLIAAKIDGADRVTLRNRMLTLYRSSGAIDEVPITSAAHLDDILTQRFLLDPPAPAATFWDRLPA